MKKLAIALIGLPLLGCSVFKNDNVFVGALGGNGQYVEGPDYIVFTWRNEKSFQHLCTLIGTVATAYLWADLEKAKATIDGMVLSEGLKSDVAIAKSKDALSKAISDNATKVDLKELSLLGG